MSVNMPLKDFAIYSTVLIFFSSLTSVEPQRSPIIVRVSPPQVKDVGGVAELECSVQYIQNYPVLWIKMGHDKTGDSLPISYASSLIVKDSRFASRHDVSSSTYTLQIKDIQETDAGTYQCQVIIDLTNKLTSDVVLQVRRPAIISDNSTVGVVKSESDSVELECYATGFPPPKISWRRENNAILPTGGSVYRGNILKIPSIRKEDRGTYYCVAENGVGKTTSRRISVDVEFPPVISVQRSYLTQALSFDMDLECHVEAYPLPSIVWIKDDIQLSNNQHYLISHTGAGTDYTDARIRILSVERRQYGWYQCKATNKLGSAVEKIELQESSTPVCPPACGNSRHSGAVIIKSSGILLFLSIISMCTHRY